MPRRDSTYHYSLEISKTEHYAKKRIEEIIERIEKISFPKNEVFLGKQGLMSQKLVMEVDNAYTEFFTHMRSIRKLKELSPDEIELLNFIDSDRILSPKGQDRFYGVSKRILDLQETKQSPEEIAKILRDSNPKNSETYKRMKKYVSGYLGKDFSWTDGIILKLHDLTHLRTLNTLSKELKNWERTLRLFSRYNGLNDSDYEIRNLDSGSLLITITAITGVVIGIGKASNYVLDSIKKYYEIKKLSADLKERVSKDQIELLSNLEKESKADLNREIDQIVIKLIELSPYKGEDKNEVFTGLKVAIKHLLKFFDEGGNISLLFSPINTKENLNTELNKSIESKQLELLKLGENKIKLLEIPQEELEEEKPISNNR